MKTAPTLLPSSASFRAPSSVFSFRSSVLSHPSSTLSAFSLVEVLAAMVVLSIIGVSILTVWSNSLDLWADSKGRMESEGDARVAIQILRRELRSMDVESDGRYFHLALPHREKKDTFGSVGFVTHIPIGAQQGDSRSQMCAVAYFRAYGPTISGGSTGQESMNLYRVVRNGAQTIDAILNSTDVFPEISHLPIDAEVVARNVAAFEIKAFVRDNSGSLQPLLEPAPNPHPDFLQINLEILDPKIARRLHSERDWLQLGANAQNRFLRTFVVKLDIQK